MSELEKTTKIYKELSDEAKIEALSKLEDAIKVRKAELAETLKKLESNKNKFKIIDGQRGEE